MTNKTQNKMLKIAIYMFIATVILGGYNIKINGFECKYDGILSMIHEKIKD